MADIWTKRVRELELGADVYNEVNDFFLAIEKSKKVEYPDVDESKKKAQQEIDKTEKEDQSEINKDKDLGYREGQHTMALTVAEALKEKQILLIEAQVGIGKSYAYLIPLVYSFKKNPKIKGAVIATSTIALQEQLMKDIAKVVEMLDIDDFEAPITKTPHVIMVVGVNGVGKTTTIGKLAYQYKKAGKSVYLGAADTFRAAAVEQLVIWGERVGVPVVKQKMGSDPASVAFDTLSSAVANHADVVIIDTAGRLHNKVGLMNELTKIKNVMKKVVPEAPQEVLLVLDGSTGQNAFEQAKQFTLATEVTAMAVTKLDGTAKGGVVIGISDQFKIPVKYIGLGEGMEDLQIFRKEEFVNSLFGDNRNK